MTDELDMLRKLQSDLSLVSNGDNEPIETLLRKTEVYLKRVFGKDSDYYEKLNNIVLKKHEKIVGGADEESWGTFKSELSSLFDSIEYEFEFSHLKGTEEVGYPHKVTFQWLKNHVPIKMWISLSSLIVAAFISGVSVSTYIYDKKKKEITNNSISEYADPELIKKQESIIKELEALHNRTQEEMQSLKQTVGGIKTKTDKFEVHKSDNTLLFAPSEK